MKGPRPPTPKFATLNEALAALGTLPRTSSGKMRRREALRRFLSDELTPPQPVNVLRLAGKLVQSALAFAKIELSRES